MYRFVAAVLLVLCAGCTSVIQPTDIAWKPGQPWPSHWGTLDDPENDGEAGWNKVLMMFVNKPLKPSDIQYTVLNEIPYAHKEGNAVEVCAAKRGPFSYGYRCRPALVDPTIVSTLQEDDVVAVFMPKKGTATHEYHPGKDGNVALRVFQRIASYEESQSMDCWIRVLYIKAPRGPDCYKRVDYQLANRLLERDFGPKAGATGPQPVSAYAAGGKAASSQ